jgi:hypothetical protein
MLTSSDRFKYELKKLMEAEIERLKETMASGNCNSHEEYKSLSGKIQGIRMVWDLIDEANAIVDGKE